MPGGFARAGLLPDKGRHVMADPELRCIAAHERDAVLDLLAGWLDDRAFFARYFAHDPTFRDDLCFVALRDGRPVSTLQVFRKTVQVDGARLAVAGIGNVYTDPAHRGAGLAGALLTHALGALADHDFDVSLLFATRLEFYGRFGWRAVPRTLSFLAAGGSGEPDAVEAFNAERDLAGVRAVYDAYNAGVPGAVVRDATYWNGQLRYAAYPDERFVVARHAGTLIAYARATPLYDLYVVHEHGCLPGATPALAALIAALHAGAPAALPGTLLQLAPDADLAAALGAYGLEPHTIEDRCWMWRVLDAPRLATRLGVPVAAVEAEDFFASLLPAARSRYWLADRF